MDMSLKLIAMWPPNPQSGHSRQAKDYY